MNNNLKPISAKASEEFNRLRQSDAVIQVKCIKCDAWYETIRRQVSFRETFNCDCGERMEFAVPAVECRGGIILPSNEEITAVGVGDDDLRLDSGMKVAEAIKRAERWWNKTGRKEAKAQLQRQAKPVGGTDNGAGQSFASNNPDDPHFMPSGIIHGQHWDALTKREKLMIVKSWHHFHIRIPDVIGSENSEPHKMQDRGRIQ